MKDILDTEIKANKKSNYALWALLSSIGSIFGFLYFNKIITGTIMAYQSLEQPLMITIRVTQILSLSSIVLLIISYLKREPRSWTKGIATLLVIIMIILFGVAFSFYYYIESIRNSK